MGRAGLSALNSVLVLISSAMLFCGCGMIQQPGVTSTMSLGTIHQNIAPNSCSACHSNDRPQTVINNFNHANGGGGDCSFCHTLPSPSNFNSFAGGTWTHTPTPTQCATCHSSDQSLQANLANTVNQMAHTIPGLPDCAMCHQTQSLNSGWISWNLETFAIGNSTPQTTLGVYHTLYPTPTTCYSCHLGERPAAAVGPSNYVHTAQGATGDCVSCHGVNKANIGLTWKVL